MADLVSLTTTDDYGHELVEHGSADFPVALYTADLLKGVVPWHWHEELEAGVILEGRCIIGAGSRRFELKAGDGFFINSGVLHGVWNADLSSCVYRSLVFSSRLISGSTDSIFHKNYVSPLTRDTGTEGILLSAETEWQRRAIILLSSAWVDGMQHRPGYEFTMRSRLSELIFLIHSNPHDRTGDADLASRRNIIRIQQMLQYIHDNYAGDTDISAIAAAAGISRSNCMRCFSSTIGMTPIQYLKQYRIRRACQLLSTTTLSINEISAQCGFNDASYFIKSFRESKGVTPSEYRTGRHRPAADC